MLAAATGVASGLFGKSSSLSGYSLHSSTPTGSPASSSTNLPSLAGPPSKGFVVGLWRVVGATHKTTNKDVSVWIFDKKVLEGVKGATQTREWAVEQLKKEATSLSRLRHPDLLHMVEPLEETRSELTFVTEYVTSSLANLISAANSKRKDGQSRPPAAESSVEIDLDEVEIQKGTLQIAKALMFLHQQAKMVHLNITPDAILVNAKGDWKLSGLNLTTPLQQPDGTSTKYVYPEVDARLPPQIQWKLDYLAPEYALDSSLTPASDLYSLGCVLFAVHMGGKPPFQNRGSMSSLRENAEGPLVTRTWASGSKWERCSSEVKDLLPRLLTRQPNQRISIKSLPSHQFFSSLAINTLNFLDPTTFASKPREEKATFLKGLVRVLPTFSDRLRRKKILPSLLEEMKDPYLLPFLLPNVFEISKTLNSEAFTPVLTKLQPLFALRDPPQNMLTLLEHISLFEEKTTPPTFREHVMPLIYNSLECEHMPVQEKVLKLVPHLCEILDYGTVQNVLLVNVAILFTKTRILSIKVQTLECFKAMVKTLDKATLTTKLVPLLAKIKTKEPAVMMATLAVHEAMGSKVDREAVATLVLPQLWAMSMGPLLNADQFAKFMGVIKTLGSRVEEEHARHLRDVRRIEQQTSTYDQTLENGSAFSTNGTNGGEMNFEDLVKGNVSPVPPTSNTVGGMPWDEGWADSNGGAESLSNAFASTSMTPSPLDSPNLGSNRPTSSGSKLKARPVPASNFNSSMFNNPSSSSSSTTNSPSIYSTPSFTPVQPQISSFMPLQPTQSTSSPSQLQQSTFPPPQAPQPSGSGSGPNYNISLSPSAPSPRPAQSSSMSFMSPPPTQGVYARPPQPPPLQPQAQAQTRPGPPQATLAPSKPPPGYSSGLMQPTVAAKPSIPTVNGKVDWGDFDPLK